MTNFAAGRAPDHSGAANFHQLERETAERNLREWLREANNLLDLDDVQRIIEEELGLA